MTKAAFVCVGTAGRSQMAAAFAEQIRTQRGRNGSIDIVTGGVDPHDRVHEEGIEVVRGEGIDNGDRPPRQITVDDVADAEYVVIMDCSIDESPSDAWGGTAEQWDLEYSGGVDLDAVRSQRDEIRRRVEDFFD